MRKRTSRACLDISVQCQEETSLKRASGRGTPAAARTGDFSVKLIWDAWRRLTTRCRRPRHRHSLPPARQSPPPLSPAPRPVPAAVFHAGCASAPPTRAVWVAASTRSCRRRGRACGTSRPTCAAPRPLRVRCAFPTTQRPPAAAPRGGSVCLQRCNCANAR